LLYGRNNILGIAAALHQSADLVANIEGGVVEIAVDDFAGHFQAGNVGSARRRGVIAHALEHVRAVDAGGVHLDQHFAGLKTGTGRSQSFRTSAGPGWMISIARMLAL
jgi:hypothetical protein